MKVWRQKLKVNWGSVVGKCEPWIVLWSFNSLLNYPPPFSWKFPQLPRWWCGMLEPMSWRSVWATLWDLSLKRKSCQLNWVSFKQCLCLIDEKCTAKSHILSWQFWTLMLKCQVFIWVSGRVLCSIMLGTWACDRYTFLWISLVKTIWLFIGLNI